MLYSIIRYLFWGGVLIAAVFLLRRTHMKNKKLLTACSVILTFVMVSVSYLIPAENLFVNFSTPETAFQYSKIGNIQKVIKGEQSAFVIYEQNKNSRSVAVFPHNGKGWKIGTGLSYRLVFMESYGKRTVTVYNAKKTNDYYVIIWESFATETAEIEDNVDSTFSAVVTDNEAIDSKNYVYYAYVNDMDEQYTLTIDGEKISLADAFD